MSLNFLSTFLVVLVVSCNSQEYDAQQYFSIQEFNSNMSKEQLESVDGGSLDYIRSGSEKDSSVFIYGSHAEGLAIMLWKSPDGETYRIDFTIFPSRGLTMHDLISDVRQKYKDYGQPIILMSSSDNAPFGFRRASTSILYGCLNCDNLGYIDCNATPHPLDFALCVTINKWENHGAVTGRWVGREASKRMNEQRDRTREKLEL